MEDLPVELYYNIFTYLKIRHQFQAFFNLNQRFNQIVLSCRSQITWQGEDDDAYYLFKHMLPHCTFRANVTDLRLEKTEKLHLIDYADLLDFPSLNALILHRLNISEDFLKILRKNLSSLRYLNISPQVSINKKCMHELLQMIIFAPNLQTCCLHLKISMCSVLLESSLKSSIKYLRLTGINDVCFADRLMIILQHLPCLQSLYINANQLNFIRLTGTNNSSCQSLISIFTLNIHEFLISFAQFSEFICTLIPNVHELKIVCRNPMQNLAYLNISEWNTCIQSLSKLKKLTLGFRHSTVIEKKIWDNNCQKLTQLMTEKLIDLRIGT